MPTTLKNGRPPHNTTGVANRSWSQLEVIAERKCSNRWAPISNKTTGTVRTNAPQIAFSCPDTQCWLPHSSLSIPVLKSYRKWDKCQGLISELLGAWAGIDDGIMGFRRRKVSLRMRTLLFVTAVDLVSIEMFFKMIEIQGAPLFRLHFLSKL